MRDPMDWMLRKFGDSACGLVAIIAVCAVLWLGGGLR